MSLIIVLSRITSCQSLENVYLRSNGILETAKERTICIDLSTSDPDLARKIFRLAKEKNINVLDAPLTGGDIGAKEGSLTTMVGGDPTVFEKIEYLFDFFCSNKYFVGNAGNGQLSKLCNQIFVSSILIGVSESIEMAENNGLDANKVLNIIKNGVAGCFLVNDHGQRILNNDFKPGGSIKIFSDDINIALKIGKNKKLYQPLLKKGVELYNKAMDAGMGNLGAHAIYKLIKSIKNHKS